MRSIRMGSCCRTGMPERRATSRIRWWSVSADGRRLSLSSAAGTVAGGGPQIYAVDQDGQLLSYGDAGTPGNVSDPVVVGFGGWQAFKFVFGGRNVAGEDHIYAVVA
jgi:hypothetical protein